MTWAIREAAAGGARRILLRGSDSPTVDLESFRAALDALEVSDLALRPTATVATGWSACASRPRGCSITR